MSMNRLLTSLAFAIALLSIGWPVLESSAQHAVAQTTGVSHEITSWNLDGTITVAVSVRLPNAFSNAEGTITPEIGCGDLDACESSDVAVVGTAQTGVTLRFFVHLSAGDNVLSIRVAASDSGGGTIEHVVDDYLISVPEAQSLVAELTEYEIIALHDDGSADLSFWFDVQQADPWPVDQFRAAIACVETHPCGTIISVSPGWGESSPVQTVHAVNLVVKRVAQGERRFLASFYDTTEQWTGPDRHDSRTYVDVTIPNALKPEVELSGYQVSAVNEDQTVDVTLDFTMTRPDASWPMSSLRSSGTMMRGGAPIV